MVMMSQGAYRCAKCIPDAFSGRKGRKARNDTTWSVPKCVLKYFMVCSECPVYVTVHVYNIPPWQGK